MKRQVACPQTCTPTAQLSTHSNTQTRPHTELSLDLRGSSVGTLSSQSFSVCEKEKEREGETGKMQSTQEEDDGKYVPGKRERRQNEERHIFYETSLSPLQR